MKKLILTTLCLLFLTGVACAEGTGSTDWDTNMLNHPILDHTHDYKEYDYQAGLGLDLVVYEGKSFDVEVQNKYDFNNHEYSGYLVGKVYLKDLLKK